MGKADDAIFGQGLRDGLAGGRGCLGLDEEVIGMTVDRM